MRTWVALLATICCVAAQAAELRVGVIDNQRIVRDSPQAAAAIKQAEADFAARVAEVQRLVKQVQALQAAYDRNAVTLSEAERSTRESEIRDLGTRAQRAERELNEDMRARESDTLRLIVERARTAIEKVAKAQKLAFVLQSSELAWFDSTIDITDAVLAEMARAPARP